MKKLGISMILAIVLASCSASNENQNATSDNMKTQGNNTVSGSVANDETPATQITETGTIVVDTGTTSVENSGSDNIDEFNPPESSGVYVQ
ncbi:MAG: hypothetical protein PHS92_01035 [Candidatus Gracilibacteria bacterium]|nr:hypothetical protein [Candidatus Gracilibacteria bacterium]